MSIWCGLGIHDWETLNITTTHISRAVAHEESNLKVEVPSIRYRRRVCLQCKEIRDSISDRLVLWALAEHRRLRQEQALRICEKGS